MQRHLEIDNLAQATDGQLLKHAITALNGVNRSSRKQLYVDLALAYAIWVQLGTTENHPLLVSMAKAVNRRLIMSEIPRIIVSFVMQYGGRKARPVQQLHSRDVQALFYLSQSGISPTEVEALAREKGQGVQKWARSMALARKPSRSASVKAPVISHDHKIVWTLPNGSEIPMSFTIATEDQASAMLGAMIELQNLSVACSLLTAREVKRGRARARSALQ